ncbi:MAG: hypothetical protein M3R36_03515 [Bacteroidota bacterium]|nr:hypothetical protein [Bacteroidota bacterium]
MLFFISYSNSFSQLHRAYTIGQDGDYPTIDSAVKVLSSVFGINAPVTFNIKTGIYNESRDIGVVFGSSPVNTVTFQSQTGNMVDVTINGFHIIDASNLILQNVTIAPINNIRFYSNRNIDITRVNFNGMSLNNLGIPTIGNNLRFTGNKNFGGMIYDEIHIVSRNLHFRNNEFTNRRWKYYWDKENDFIKKKVGI